MHCNIASSSHAEGRNAVSRPRPDDTFRHMLSGRQNSNFFNEMRIHLRFVCAQGKSGARIAISSRARVSTMKKNSLRRPIRSAATGLLGMLMPVALSTTAQTPPPLPPMPANIESAAATAVAHTQPAAYRTGLVPQVQAPAAGFNVANIESMAQQLTYGERVPGMAVAIVQGGRILSARGYGVTDVNNPLLRVATWSAFAMALTGAWLLIWSFKRRKRKQA